VSSAIRRDIENLEILSRTVDEDAVRAIANAVHSARRTVVTGSGTFAAPGVQLAHACTTMGLDVMMERNFGTQLANTVRRLVAGDCLVTVNFWWLPRAVVHATRIAHERGATTCVLTDLHSSPLAAAANHLVVIPSEGVGPFPSLVPAMSVVNGVHAEISRLGGGEVSNAMGEAEGIWERMELFHRRG
jgi:DNA-binding MurR/RpiR family transcriptional regulator